MAKQIEAHFHIIFFFFPVKPSKADKNKEAEWLALQQISSPEQNNKTSEATESSSFLSQATMS